MLNLPSFDASITTIVSSLSSVDFVLNTAKMNHYIFPFFGAVYSFANLLVLSKNEETLKKKVIQKMFVLVLVIIRDRENK